MIHNATYDYVGEVIGDAISQWIEFDDARETLVESILLAMKDGGILEDEEED